MTERNTREFFLYFARSKPLRTLVMVAMLIGAGMAEGVGIAGLLPLLEIGVSSGGGEPSGVSRRIAELIGILGLQPTLGVLLLIVVGAMAIKGLLRWLAMRQVGYVVARVAMDLRLRLIRALLKADWSYFSTRPVGYFANSISSEAHRAANSYRMACNAIADLAQAGVYAVIVFLVSPRIALLAALAGGGIILGLRRLVDSARVAGEQQTDLMRSMVARLTEALPGLKPLKAMGKEDYVLPLLEAETRGFYDAQQKQVFASVTLFSLQEPILVAVLAVGLFVVLTWTSTPFSTVLVLAFLFYRLVIGLNRVQQRYQDMAVGESAFWSMMHHLEEAEAAEEVGSGALEPPRLEDAIRFDDVSFWYEEGHPVLSGVELEIPSGEFVALVGPSGSGKSTLADLVVGLLRPKGGQIRVDGVPLINIDPAAWRRQIGYVPQDLLLFHDTIRRNVSLGDESIGAEQVERALRDAGAWEFVSRLPDGMDQLVGERGSLLSGGQRQRIAIARALVAGPRLLVLDEATTALDPATEAAICDTLARLKGRVTILSISHQHAMRQVADTVYELENLGTRLVEGSAARAGS
jgi:ATP-binding cassette subfamily C protein